MEFTVKSGNPEKQRTACVVLGVFEPRRLSPVAEKLDEITGGYISNLIRRGDLEGKLGQTLLLHNVPNTLCDRVLLIGCGRERELGDSQYLKIITKAASTLNASSRPLASACSLPPSRGFTRFSETSSANTGPYDLGSKAMTSLLLF